MQKELLVEIQKELGNLNKSNKQQLFSKLTNSGIWISRAKAMMNYIHGLNLTDIELLYLSKHLFEITNKNKINPTKYFITEAIKLLETHRLVYINPNKCVLTANINKLFLQEG